MAKTSLQASKKLLLIQELFNCCFKSKYQTILVFGAKEPFYKASEKSNELNIVYSRDLIESSALHEIAHWCIAGSERRKKNDYGYWYAPDGRNEQEQKKFYRIEAKPQALEAIFSEKLQIKFRVSADNLTGSLADLDNFAKSVDKQKKSYLKNGLPARAQQFLAAIEESKKEEDDR